MLRVRRACTSLLLILTLTQTCAAFRDRLGFASPIIRGQRSHPMSLLLDVDGLGPDSHVIRHTPITSGYERAKESTLAKRMKEVFNTQDPELIDGFLAQVSKQPANLTAPLVAHLMHRSSKSGNSLHEYISLSTLAAIIGSEGVTMSAREIGMCMYGLRHCTLSTPGINPFLSAIECKLRSVTTAEAWSVSSICYGLKGMTSNSQVNQLLQTVTPLMQRCVATQVLDPWIISNIMYGLQKMKLTAEVRTIFELLRTHIAARNISLTARALQQCLYGLSGKPPSDKYVYKMLETLAEQVELCQEELLPHHISGAFYGLRGMHDTYPPVQKLLLALVKHASRSVQPFSSQAIGNILYSLSGMSSNSEAVKNVLRVTAEKAQLSEFAMSPQELSIALYGLQHMDSSVHEVRLVLSVLLSKMHQECGMWRGEHMGAAFIGIQGMETSNDEVRAVLLALGRNIKRSTSMVNSQAVVNMLLGLQNKDCEVEEVRAVIRLLLDKIEYSQVRLRALEVASGFRTLHQMTDRVPEVRLLLGWLTDQLEPVIDHMSTRNISNVLYGLKEMGVSSEVKRVLRIVSKHMSQTTANDTAPVSLGCAFIGLQHKFSEVEEVRDLLRVLTSQIVTNSQPFGAVTLSSILNGLSSMGSECNVVLQTIDVIHAKVMECDEEFSDYVISMCLHGLQSCSADSTQVRSILHTLTLRLQEHPDATFSSESLGKCFAGLQSMSDDVPEVRQLLSALIPKLRHLCDTDKLGPGPSSTIVHAVQCMNFGSKEVDTVLDLLHRYADTRRCNIAETYTPSRMSLMLRGLARKKSKVGVAFREDVIRAMSSISGYTTAKRGSGPGFGLGLAKDILTVVRALRLERRPLPKWIQTAMDENGAPAARKHLHTHIHSQLYADISKAFPNEMIKFHSILGGFEFAILFPNRRINFEIDGYEHDRPNQRLYDSLRDELMEESGIHVHRIRVGDMSGNSSTQLVTATIANILNLDSPSHIHTNIV